MKALIAVTMVAGAFTVGACDWDRYRDRDRDVRPGVETMPEERTRAAETMDADNQRKNQLEQQRDRIVDELYQQYGGGDTARATDSQLVNKLDKATFQQRCEDVGQGDVDQDTADDREEQFFHQATVIAKCRQVHQLNEQIDQID